MQEPTTYATLSRLLPLAHEGDHEAREKIFSFLGERIRLLAKLRLVKEDTEDVVQETMMVVTEHFLNYQTLESLFAFTDGVLRNRIGNHFRKRDRRRRLLEMFLARPQPPCYVEDVLAEESLEQRVRMAIDRLGQRSPGCRQALLGLCEGMTWDELSRLLELQGRPLTNKIFRCRAALRRILDKEFGLRL
ncbi:MAG: sigma-70 family RNA polymerase sigma factor [Acidobacteria bacterium]|nr:sigma-70 family RNA polymerase sigma factor [Acidobacteriota bacterium]